MLQAFVVTLREGLEAFLIVAISLAYLRKTGRQGLIPAVHWGIVASIVVSVGAGVLLAQGRQSGALGGDPGASLPPSWSPRSSFTCGEPADT